MRIYLVLALTVLFGKVGLGQQLPQKSVFTEAGFIWNPAMTANWGFTEFGAIFRKQWVTFNDAPRTANAYIQAPINKYNMGLGGYVVNDQAGALTHNYAAFTYSYKIKLGLTYSDQLALGIGVNLSQFRLDGSRANARQSNDPLLAGVVSTRMNPNVSFGLFYSSRTQEEFDFETSWYGGISAQHIIPTSVSFETQSDVANFQRVFYGNAVAGARFVKDFSFLEPSIWLDYSPDELLLATFNFRYEYYQVFWLGSSLSTDWTGALQAGFIVKGGILQDGRLRIGVSTNLNLGKLSDFRGIGYEFFTGYRIDL